MVQAVRGEGDAREFDVGGLWIRSNKFTLASVAPRSQTGLMGGESWRRSKRPYVTKTEGWLNLALKRVITMAVKADMTRWRLSLASNPQIAMT